MKEKKRRRGLHDYRKRTTLWDAEAWSKRKRRKTDLCNFHAIAEKKRDLGEKIKKKQFGQKCVPARDHKGDQDGGRGISNANRVWEERESLIRLVGQ